MRVSDLKIKTLGVITALCLLTACDRAPTNTTTPTNPASVAANTSSDTNNIHHQALFSAIRQQGKLSLHQSHRKAQALLASAESFIQNTDQLHWQQLQQQWLNSHQQWHHSDSYLPLLAAPNDELAQLRLRLHNNVVTPGYLDHIEGYPHSGIVHDNTLPLNAQTVLQQHRRFSNEETAAGIHVLEFFIWDRNLDDYSLVGLDKQQSLATSRRRQYLHLLAQQWLTDIQQAQQFWQQDIPLLAPDSIKLRLQQQLGALVDNNHCQFSHDNTWRSAVVDMLSQHITSLPALNELQRQLSSTAAEATIKQTIGELMLNLQLKAH
jgi:putative iron-regulated protein